MTTSTRARSLVLALLVAAAPACDRAEPAPSTAPEPSASAAGGGEVAGVRYLERALGGAAPDDKLPMIVAIHGRGDDADHFVELFSGLRARARLVVPYGETPFESGFSWFDARVQSDPAGAAAGVSRAAKRLDGFIEALVAARPTVGKPIVTGFSQGAMLSYALAVLYPEHVAQAVPVSGVLPAPLVPATWPEGKPRPAIRSLHGDRDQVLPIEADRSTVEDLRKLGFPAELREYTGVDHGISPGMRSDLYDVLTAALEAAKSARAR